MPLFTNGPVVIDALGTLAGATIIGLAGWWTKHSAKHGAVQGANSALNGTAAAVARMEGALGQHMETTRLDMKELRENDARVMERIGDIQEVLDVRGAVISGLVEQTTRLCADHDEITHILKNVVVPPLMELPRRVAAPEEDGSGTRP